MVVNKVFRFFVFAFCVLSIVACPPPQSATSPNVRIYVGEKKLENINALVGDETKETIIVELQNAIFDETKVRKNDMITSWFSLSKLDSADENASIEAIITDFQEMHINKTTKKRFDKAVVDVKIKSQKEAMGELMINVPSEAILKESVTKSHQGKSLSGANKIRIDSKKIKFVNLSASPSLIKSDYTFGKTNKKEVLLSLDNGVFDKSILKNEVLKDIKKWSKYFTVSCDNSYVNENYKFSFETNAGKNESIKFVLTSKTIIRDLFSIDSVPIIIKVKKDAVIPNRDAIRKEGDLIASFNFSKDKEESPSVSIVLTEDKSKTNTVDLQKDKTKDIAVSILLKSDGFNKETVESAKEDLASWFSIDGSGTKIEKIEFKEIVESEVSKNETDKVYNAMTFIVTVKGLSIHELDKKDILKIEVPYAINGSLVLLRSKLNLKGQDGIHIIVKQ